MLNTESNISTITRETAMMIRGKAELDARTVRAAGGDIELKETAQFVIDQGKVLDAIITHTAKCTDRCAKKFQSL